MNQFEQQLLSIKPLKVSSSEGYEVRHIEKSSMNGFFGYALQNKVFIANNLSKRVSIFVIKHEIYHLKDRRSDSDWVGSETRANLNTGLHDPLGLLATVKASLTRQRVGKYLRLLYHSRN